MKRTFLILLLLFSPLLIAQNFEETTNLNPGLTSNSPPSPDAAALLKFIDTPVGEATGIPQVSLPIYNFKDAVAGTNVPISLEYHAGGVRVAEIASRVGMGWALNAGGIINRARMGIQDEQAEFGFWEFNIPEEMEGNSPGDIEFRPFNRMYAKVGDSQPDIFSYSFPGGSGKFLLGKNNDFINLGQNNLKIDFSLDYNVSYVDGRAISAFRLRDDNGIEYFFEELESVQVFPIDVNDSYTSSWHLSKIVSPEKPGDTIRFIYEPEYLDRYNVSYNHQMYRQFGDFAGQETVNATSSSQSVYSKRLSKIDFPNGAEVNFQYADPQQYNGPGGAALKTINISDGSNSRSFNLHHDQSTNRRTLKEVTMNSGENSEGKYELQYEGILPDASTIPDHWGFYTGVSTSRIPREIFDGGLDNTGVYELPGGNRDTDSLYVKYGSLKKIIYPTGGYTIFDMEANRANDARLDKEFSVTMDGPGGETKSEISTVDSNSNYGDDVVDITYNGDPQQVTNFEIIVGQGELSCTNCKVIATLFNDTNYYAPHISQVEIDILEYGNSTGTFNVFNLIPGHTYKLLLQVQNINNFYSYVTVNWEERKEHISNTRTYTHKQDYVGGLRIKRILNYNGTDLDPVLVKEYAYTLEDGVTSSGTLGAYPVYSQAVFYENRHSLPNPQGDPSYQPPNPAPEYYKDINPNVIVRSSSSIFDLPSYLGSPVIYKRVVIKQQGDAGGSNGKEIKYFSNFDDYPVLVDNYFPYTPTVMNFWNYGLLQKHEIFNSQDVKIQQTENIFQFSQDRYFESNIRLNNFKAVTIAPVMFFSGLNIPSSTDLPPLGIPIYFKSDYYYPSAGRSDLLHQITTTFYDGVELSSSKSYTYDTEFFKPQTVITHTSSGDEVMKEIDYAFELLGTEDPSGFHQKLFTMHKINEVVEERTKINKPSQMALISSSRKEFMNWGSNNLKVKHISTKKGEGNFEARMNYYSYDSKGNPQEVSMTNGPHIVYIWGYNKTVPIAKIENVTSSEIVNVIGDLALINETDALIINSLRSSLEKAHITTYTYNPLVGVTSITDPRGDITTFHYNDFNKLEFVKDKDGNILKEHKYKYKNNL